MNELLAALACIIARQELKMQQDAQTVAQLTAKVRELEARAAAEVDSKPAGNGAGRTRKPAAA